MESSFKKKYDKTTEQDGSIVLKFKSERIGAHFGSGLGSIIILLLLPVSCTVTSPVMMALSSGSHYRDDFPTGSLIIWNICAIALWVFAVRWMNIKTSIIKIIPNSGIEFKGKRLPFADIQTIGAMNETTARNAKGTAYIYANSHGNQIKITNYMLPELANAICSEIKKSSGVSFH